MLVFRGAEVFPGDGPSFHTDVGVAGGTIVAVADGLEGEVVDATGAMLCPGFIDLHAHSALAPFDDPLLAPKVLQGFTTEVICPDGLAPAPVADWRARQAYLRALEGEGPAEWPWSTFAEYLDALEATRPAMTLVPSVGHGAVRDFVVGGERVPPRLDEMRHEVRLAFEAGARMLSFGLVYFPGHMRTPTSSSQSQRSRPSSAHRSCRTSATRAATCSRPWARWSRSLGARARRCTCRI
jgi:N-acyl-D-amino-acid deacylase